MAARALQALLKSVKNNISVQKRSTLIIMMNIIMDTLPTALFWALELILLYLFWAASFQSRKQEGRHSPQPSLMNMKTELSEGSKLTSKDSVNSVASSEIDSLLLSEKDPDDQSDQGKPFESAADLGEKSDFALWGQETILKWGSEESMERKRALITNEIIQVGIVLN